MKWILGFMLCGLAASASGQSIYKCRDAKGQAVYQSDPCPEAEKRWDTLPRDYTWDDYYKRTDADKRIERDRAYMRGRAQGMNAPSAASGTHITTRDAGRCAAAKAHRESVLEQVGMRRNFQLLRELDSAVWEACK